MRQAEYKNSFLLRKNFSVFQIELSLMQKVTLEKVLKNQEQRGTDVTCEHFCQRSASDVDFLHGCTRLCVQKFSNLCT